MSDVRTNALDGADWYQRHNRPNEARFLEQCAEDREILAIMGSAPRLNAGMFVVASRYLLDGFQRTLCSSDQPLDELHERILQRREDFETVLRTRSPQQNDNGRTAFVEPLLRQLGRCLLLDFGASGGLALSAMRRVHPQSIFVGLDQQPLYVRSRVDMNWLLAFEPEQEDSWHRLKQEIRRAQQDPPVVMQGNCVDDVERAIHRLRQHGIVDESTPVVLLESCVDGLLTDDVRSGLHQFPSAPDTALRLRCVVDSPTRFSDSPMPIAFVAEIDRIAQRGSHALSSFLQRDQEPPFAFAVGDPRGNDVVTIEIPEALTRRSLPPMFVEPHVFSNDEIAAALGVERLPFNQHLLT